MSSEVLTTGDLIKWNQLILALSMDAAGTVRLPGSLSTLRFPKLHRAIRYAVTPAVLSRVTDPRPEDLRSVRKEVDATLPDAWPVLSQFVANEFAYDAPETGWPLWMNVFWQAAYDEDQMEFPASAMGARVIDVLRTHIDRNDWVEGDDDRVRPQSDWDRLVIERNDGNPMLWLLFTNRLLAYRAISRDLRSRLTTEELSNLQRWASAHGLPSGEQREMPELGG
jgi:hypothetical protein